MVDTTKLASVDTIFYKKGVTYSITINPDDSYQYWKRHSRVALWHKASFEKMSMLDGKGIQYELYPDISLPVDSGKGRDPRLHWHGTITFEHHLAILYWLLAWREMSEWCYINIDTIADEKVWHRYCTKTMHILGPLRRLKNKVKLEDSESEASDSD